MSAHQFIEFGDRIVNVSRIVSMAPPMRTADGYELEVRVDGYAFKEVYGDADEATDRFTSLAGLLLGAPLRAATDPERLGTFLRELAADVS